MKARRLPHSKPEAARVSFHAGRLQVHVFDTARAMARAAAARAGAELLAILRRQRAARVILASAASQVQFLGELVTTPGLDWSRVTLFHMDEYLGVGEEHPASFRRFLREHVLDRVRPRQFHSLHGDADEPIRECERYARLLRQGPIDLCCLGIGENGHLAFNDPPVAHFSERRTVKLVQLDEACRRQQVGEGAFPTLEAVPRFAYTLTVPALSAARRLICVVPEQRKAEAVRKALEGPVTTQCPASFLRRLPHATLYLDADSAGALAARKPRA